MFNVTVIRLKDIIKIIAIVGIIYILGNFVFKNIQLKNYFNQSININIDEFVKMGLNKESSIFRYISGEKEAEQERTEEVEADLKNISAKTILTISSKVFETKEKEQNLGQEQNETPQEEQETNTNSEEQEIAQIQEVTTDTNTQVVTQNPIAERYNKEYNGIKIRNESSYELTDDMLNPENLDIDKKDIIIFHTHTCESYTQTENYQYEPSRKLQNNKSKFFSCTRWR